MKTPYSVRLELSELTKDELIAITTKPDDADTNVIYSALAQDTMAVQNYRSASDPVTYTSFREWFGDRVHTDIPFGWIDARRDYIFTAAGVQAVSYTHLDVYKRQVVR